MDSFKRTWMIRAIEEEMHLNLPKYLKRKYWDEGWTYAEIADDLGISATTVGKYLRQLGWTTKAAAQLAYENGLLKDEPYLRGDVAS